SPHMINEGEKLFKQGLVNNIKSKKIGKYYHIYGTVEGKGNILTFNTHLTIDLDTKLLNSSNCSCNDYKEASKYKKDFLCRHLVGTNYMFRSIVLKKYSNKNKKLTTKEVGENILCLLEEKINDEREVLKLEIKITYIESKKSSYYEVEFRIGNENMYLINNLEEFIDFKEREEVLRLNNQFVYKPKLQRFDRSDEKIFDFIKEYATLNKQLILKNNLYTDLQIIKGKTLRILPSTLKHFLQLSSHKKVRIKYGGMEYVAPIILSLLPIKFNLKEKNNNFILSTYSNKNLPKVLMDSGEVYFFDRKIYIPSEESNKVYNILMEQILKYGELRFSKSSNNFIRIMKILNKVTKYINFDEAVKRFYNEISKPHFYIHKKSSHIICSTKINYGNDIVDILKEYDGDNLIVRDKLKEEKLVMLLEKLKFIKKKNVFIFMGN
ncbi:MAG: SNF2 helicase associated domain-containing protein, partial [Sarcina sp.]